MSLQLNGTAGVTYNDGSNQPAAASPIGTKNLIINGNMQIAQRGTSETGITSLGYYTVDRIKFICNSIGTWTNTQDTDVPTGQGLSNSFKLQCTTADASLGANDALQIQTRLEGQNLQHLKKGTSSAEKVTLSFWVKSNKTGTYIVEARDMDNTRHFPKSYTIDTADTWEKKTITFDGDTTGTLDNDNNASFDLQWWLGAGTTWTTGTLPTSWGSIVNANRAAGQTVNLADSTSNYINITGVQLEVNDTATPFEVMPYDMQLARCQRYYYLHASGFAQSIGNGTMYTSALGYIFIHLPVTLRGNPSLVVTNFTSMRAFQSNGFANPTDMTIWTSYNPNVAALRTTVSRSVGSVFMDNGGSGDNRIAFDAEL